MTSPLWRSLLYVPAHNDHFVAKAHTRGADAIQLDLEDSVPPDRKDEARQKARESAPDVARSGADIVVRINRSWRLALHDLEAVVSRHVHALALPKVDSPGHVALVDEVLSELESERGLSPGSTQLIAMIETAGGFLQAEQIAASSPRLAALTLGSEDFALSIGVKPDPDVMAYPKQHVAIAARAAGLAPIGLVGTLASYDDLDAFRDVARRSRRLGCEGASAIHPAQVPILNEEFSPTADEVEEAEQVLRAYENALSHGEGATTLNGNMIDNPVVERAQRLLDRHAQIQRRERSGQS